MPARDIYHDAVRHALIKDGWTITADPFRIPVGQRTVYVDLAAERMIAAEKGQERIAVEVKSFVAASELHELEAAVGQYAFYRALMERADPERRLYLAVPRLSGTVSCRSRSRGRCWKTWRSWCWLSIRCGR